jgi:hypothetical protein
LILELLQGGNSLAETHFISSVSVHSRIRSNSAVLPQNRHKYYNLQRVLALLRVVVNSASHKNMAPKKLLHFTTDHCPDFANPKPNAFEQCFLVAESALGYVPIMSPLNRNGHPIS